MDVTKQIEYGKYPGNSGRGGFAAVKNSNRKTLAVFSIMLCVVAYDLIRAEYERKLARITELAGTDPLTNVKSRVLYEEKLLDINKTIRTAMPCEFAIVVCDVNGLKITNDNYGHSVGDKLLQNTSNEICHVFSHSPVFRVGGDEFVAILTGEDYKNRSNLLDELKKRSDGKPPQAFFAFGCADYLRGIDKDVKEVFERADAQMYRDKKLRGYVRPEGINRCG